MVHGGQGAEVRACDPGKFANREVFCICQIEYI